MMYNSEIQQQIKEKLEELFTLCAPFEQNGLAIESVDRGYNVKIKTPSKKVTDAIIDLEKRAQVYHSDFFKPVDKPAFVRPPFKQSVFTKTTDIRPGKFYEFSSFTFQPTQEPEKVLQALQKLIDRYHNVASIGELTVTPVVDYTEQKHWLKEEQQKDAEAYIMAFIRRTAAEKFPNVKTKLFRSKEKEVFTIYFPVDPGNTRLDPFYSQLEEMLGTHKDMFISELDFTKNENEPATRIIHIAIKGDYSEIAAHIQKEYPDLFEIKPAIRQR